MTDKVYWCARTMRPARSHNADGPRYFSMGAIQTSGIAKQEALATRIKILISKI